MPDNEGAVDWGFTILETKEKARCQVQFSIVQFEISPVQTAAEY